MNICIMILSFKLMKFHIPQEETNPFITILKTLLQETRPQELDGGLIDSNIQTRDTMISRVQERIIRMEITLRFLTQQPKCHIPPGAINLFTMILKTMLKETIPRKLAGGQIDSHTQTRDTTISKVQERIIRMVTTHRLLLYMLKRTNQQLKFMDHLRLLIPNQDTTRVQTLRQLHKSKDQDITQVDLVTQI